MENELGQTLHQRRKDRELSLVDLSKLSGVSPAHIARVERGVRFPSALVLGKLAKPLGFAEVELLKLAGLLSWDTEDIRLEAFKTEMKDEIIAIGADVLHRLFQKINGL